MKGTLKIDYDILNNDKNPKSAYLSVYSGYIELAMLYNKKGHDIENQRYGQFISDPIPKGKHQITLKFEKYLSYDMFSKVIIKSIKIENDKDGSASECTPCDIGSICPAGI
jgi:hypothetical protein